MRTSLNANYIPHRPQKQYWFLLFLRAADFPPVDDPSLPPSMSLSPFFLPCFFSPHDICFFVHNLSQETRCLILIYKCFPHPWWPQDMSFSRDIAFLIHSQVTWEQGPAIKVCCNDKNELFSLHTSGPFSDFQLFFCLPAVAPLVFQMHNINHILSLWTVGPFSPFLLSWLLQRSIPLCSPCPWESPL